MVKQKDRVRKTVNMTMDPDIIEEMRALAAANRRPISTEYQIAAENHLAAQEPTGE